MSSSKWAEGAARRQLFPTEITKLDAAAYAAFDFHAGGGPADFLRVHGASLDSNPPLATLLRSQRALDMVAFAAVVPAMRAAANVAEAQAHAVRLYEIGIALQLARAKGPLASAAREFLDEMKAAGHGASFGEGSQ